MQNFTLRGIEAATVMRGVKRAFADAARELGMSAALMVIAQRHRAEQTAFELLDQLMPWAADIVAIGLGGPEVGHPPSKFASFVRECRNRGFRIVIHAGEEGPASYVREAFELDADRIDHGIACIDDAGLVRALAARGTPLTLCPLSNLRLKVVASLDGYPLRRLIDQGVTVTLNSDDPSYFGGYINDNFRACVAPMALSGDEIIQLVRNGFAASFLPPDAKRHAAGRIDRAEDNNCVSL
jgi:adenosine deaminase